MVIDGVSMSIRPGEEISICGRSGSGQTSLLPAIFGLLELADGKISIDGVDLMDVSPKETPGTHNYDSTGRVSSSERTWTQPAITPTPR